jgi:two-component sensor histidine kinase
MAYSTVQRNLFYVGAFLVATAALGIAAASGRIFAPRPPAAERGSLDLRNWDFSRSLSVPLGGEWSFVPDRLVNGSEFDSIEAGYRRVPDTRFMAAPSIRDTSGSGTYRMKILLGAQSRNLALRYSAARTAMEIEVNGSVVAEAGRPSLERALARPAFRSGIVRLNAGEGELDLVVRVSNHEHRWGGIAQAFTLGEEHKLTDGKRTEDTWLLLVVGALVGVAGNSFFIFTFRKRERAYLHFALFALLVALRALVTGDYLAATIFPGLGYDAIIRIEYAALYLLVPAGTLFFSSLFPEDVSRFEFLAHLLPSLAFALLIPFAPLLVLSWSLLPYAIIGVISVVTGYLILCVRPLRHHRTASGIVFTAGTLLFISGISNIAYATFVSHGEHGFPLGLPIFVIVQTLALAARFTKAFDTVETLSAQLASTNAQLEGEIGIATDARRRMELALAEKDILIREVHHRVKNSLQIVTSIINLQSHRAKDPAALEAYRSVSDRIRAIASVHDKLYGLESEKRIDLGEYARDLMDQFSKSYGQGAGVIELEADKIEVPMDLCIEIGLVLTELVVNSFRHALIPTGRGSIRIELRRDDGEMRLVVADMGPGFPSGYVPGATNSVGFKIVTSLVSKRSGRVELSAGPCAKVTVHIPFAAEDPAHL